jgi:hypothetical protein
MAEVKVFGSLISCSKLSLEKVSVDSTTVGIKKGCKIRVTVMAESLPLSIAVDPRDDSKRFIEVLGSIKLEG